MYFIAVQEITLVNFNKAKKYLYIFYVKSGTQKIMCQVLHFPCIFFHLFLFFLLFLQMIKKVACEIIL